MSNKKNEQQLIEQIIANALKEAFSQIIEELKPKKTKKRKSKKKS